MTAFLKRKGNSSDYDTNPPANRSTSNWAPQKRRKLYGPRVSVSPDTAQIIGSHWKWDWCWRSRRRSPPKLIKGRQRSGNWVRNCLLMCKGSKRLCTRHDSCIKTRLKNPKNSTKPTISWKWPLKTKRISWGCKRKKLWQQWKNQAKIELQFSNLPTKRSSTQIAKSVPAVRSTETS